MVRETRHLWVGNLPDNIREDRIREHFKRYGRVQSVKLLPRVSKEETGETAMACTVAFMDIKSASKAHTSEHKIDDRTLTTEYYEPAAIPSSASPQNTPSSYSTSPGSTRFPNGHGSTEEHATFNDRFYERSNSRVGDTEFVRRTSYPDNNRSRTRDRGYRNGPYNNIVDRTHRPINSWPYDSTTRYNSQTNETGYTSGATETSERRSSDTTQAVKKKTKSRSGSRSPSPGSTSSRSPSRSRSRSSSSSSSSSTSRATSSTGSPKSRRLASSGNASHQPVVHSEDRRPLAICVRNLPLRSSDTSLKDGLFHEYKKHGKVTWVKVVGQSSERHAIVCFKKPEDVEKALEVSYDKMFFGSKIEVAPYQGYDVEDNDLRPYEAEIDEFHPKATRTLFIGNLEKDVTASDLRKHFEQFGEIIEIDIKKQGAVSSYAFCQYSDIVSVVKAIRSMDGEHLGNNRVKLGFGKSMPTNCVWVDGVTESVNEKYLMMQFDPFGAISQIYIDREKGQALIFYEQVINAQAAVIKMRGVNLRGRKMQVDFASRECQEAFYEHLEKQGHILDRPNFEERRDSTSRSFETAISASSRYSRYDTPTRPRTSSYSSRSSAATSQGPASAAPSPGAPGTPRAGSARPRPARFADYYDQAGIDYADRHFRGYDEYSQGSAASHEDLYEHGYDSPQHADALDARSLQSLGDVFDYGCFQKDRVHLLEPLEDCASSGDELLSSKKRLKLDLLDSANDVIIEANRDHRKVMEVRRLSDVSLRHRSRRPSADSGKHSRSGDAPHAAYAPHAVCKRRRTAGSDGGPRGPHHCDRSGSDSAGGSRPGTPLVDERPEHFPNEPRRLPRDRDGPLSLPLPKFAAHVPARGGVSVAGVKGRGAAPASPPAVATSPRVAPRPPSPARAPPPASPPPRPPSLSPSSSDSDAAPPSPSLDERIRSLDEKYEKWSGSRALSAAGNDALAKLDANRDRFRFRHKFLDLDLKELQPSEIVKSVMAKRSVFDEDSKRLENVGEKYEPRDFNLFPRSVTAVQTTVPATPLSAPQPLKVSSTVQLPKTPTMLSPRSTGSTSLTAAKGLQYPFPSHPPLQPPTQSIPTTSATSLSTTPASSTSTTSRGSSHGDNRLKPCVTASSDNRTPSKVSVNRSATNSSVVSNLNKTDNSKNVVIPTSASDSASANTSAITDTKQGARDVKTGDKVGDKVAHRRDSANSTVSPRCEVKTRRSSDTSARKHEETSEHDKTEELKKEQQRLEKMRVENEKLEREKAEKERQERERLEKERIERERLEKEKEIERLEKERQEKERIEKEKAEKERQEREPLERERRRQREERERREKEEREEQERKERKEREERERREREERERERREREEKERERRELAERERLEREERERERRERAEKERERRELEERERRERERERREREEKERERRELEEKERREREERERRERQEREKREEEARIAEKERLEKEKEQRKREKEEERKHKDDNHEKRKEDHLRYRENHSESRHRESSIEFRNDKHIHDNKNTKDYREDRNKENPEQSRKDSYESRISHDNKEAKSRHHIERDAEKRKESSKENNIHEKTKNCLNEIREYKDRPAIESRHMSIELDKNRQFEINPSSNKPEANRRKERNNSLPANIGSKRRMSSHETPEGLEDKRAKLSTEYKKLSERRDSKDGRNEDKSKTKHKNGSSKTHDDKMRVDKHNSTREGCEEKRKDKEERHKNKQAKLEKQKTKKRDKETCESVNMPITPPKDITDKDFLARLDLRATEEVEKQKQQRKETKDRKKSVTEMEERKDDTKRIEERRKEKYSTSERKTHEETIKTIEERNKSAQKKDRIRKMTQNSSDNNTDSDEPKKHSIFDIVDDEPAYISMYDKVKARSCKNMQKQEEEKRQEKIKAKFSQLKQSRAKREEKKRSTSWDEDSDSERERHEGKSDGKIRRGNKLLIASSDEDEHMSKPQIKHEIYGDSDSDKQHRHMKQELSETSEDDRMKSKNLQRKGSKSRIASDTSDDEFKKIKSRIKLESSYSDNEVDQGFADSEEKPYRKVKDEYDDKFVKKERKSSKHQDSLEQINAQIFGDSNSPLPEIKQEKFNNRLSCGENSSADESMAVKKEKSEMRKKHKKKQKRQKNCMENEEMGKIDSVMEMMHAETNEKSRHFEKKKQHSKKEKRKDKNKEDKKNKDKSEKSKKNKSESSKSDVKRDGKMENIFGSLSEDSENGAKDQEKENQNSFMDRYSDENIPMSYASDSDSVSHEREAYKAVEEKERLLKEEHKKRKEKRRREKERRLREEANNENSMDYADMGKLLEENIKDDATDISEDAKPQVDSEKCANESIDPSYSFQEGVELQDSSKESRKETKEKKKKRKKSKEEKQNRHHHHHHHDKNKERKSPEIKKEPSTEIKTESDTKENQSLPNILDIPSPTQKPLEYPQSPIHPPHEPLLSPISKTPTSKEKKREKLIPGFGSEIDEKIHENAVKSISEFETPKPEIVKEVIEEIKPEKAAETNEEKPRVVISQEETEDAVAALLGESFGSNQYSSCYEEELNQSNEEQTSSVAEESIQQDDEEMRQAVQSLNTGDMEIKPDTPQSENDLQIDTDTEETEDMPMRYDQIPRTPEMVDLSHPPKTPDIPNYYRSEDNCKQTPVILKNPPNIGSPPLLTPIRSLNSPSDIKKTVENAVQPPKVLSLPNEPKETKENLSVKYEEKIPPLSIPTPTVVTVQAQNVVNQPPTTVLSSITPTKTPPVIKIGENQYPTLTALPKQNVNLSPRPEASPKPTQSLQKAQPPPLTHNLPQRPPYPVISQQKPPQEMPKSTTGNIQFSRLPITPMMVSKPLQSTTVILPQAKVAHSLEPPKLVSTSDPRPQERPRMVYQAPTTVSQYPGYLPPRVMVQSPRGAPAPGLLMPTKKLPVSGYNYMPNIVPPVYSFSKEKSEQISASEAQKVLPTSVPVSYSHAISQPHNVISPNRHTVVLSSNVKPVPTTTTESKTFTPVIQETPKVIAYSAPKTEAESIIKPVTTTVPIPSQIPEIKPEKLTIKIPEEESKLPLLSPKISSPSVLVIPSPHKEPLPSPVKTEISSPKPEVVPEKPKESAAVPEQKEETITSPVTEEKPAVTETKVEMQKTETEVKNQEGEKVEIKPELSPRDDKENLKIENEIQSVIKETEKFEEERADTESVISDISKERSSAEILNKDDALDSKEDSDYWSAKEVNIDSVIKTLCSADELSDRSSEVGKDEWLDEHKNELEKENKPEETSPELKEENVSIESSKTEEESFEENTDANLEEKDVSVRGRRTGRGRGRKTRGTDRLTVQTRRSKTAKEAVVATTPSKRGGRGGKQKIERKISKSESETADVYEFRDDSDENNANKDRPRLILTIKSPAITSAGNNATQTAIVKEVVKEKEVTPPQPKVAENKEEFVSPASNTRKSRRLQEKDVSRNTVDDTIEDVVRNTAIVTRSTAAAAQGQSPAPRRSARQTAAKTLPETPRKSPRGARKKDRRGSETTDDSSEEKSLKTETPVKSDAEVNKEIEKPKETVEEEKVEAPKKPHEGLKATVLRRIKGEMSQEPMTLIDPVTGLLTPMRECEEGRYIPVPGAPMNLQQKPAVAENPQQQQQSVITTPISAGKQQQQQQQKPQSLKAHVLSSQEVKPVVTQQQQQIPQPQQQKQPPALQQQQQPTVLQQQQPPVLQQQQQQNFVSKPTPISQNLSVNVSLPNFAPTHLSPRPNLPISKQIHAVPKTPQPPPLSPSQMAILTNQQKILQQVNKQQIPTVVTKSQMSPMINTPLAHVKPSLKHQPVVVSKAQLPKQSQGHAMGISVLSPTVKQQPTIPSGSNAVRLQMPAKGVMEPPKVDVSLVPRPHVSPQGQPRHVLQAGMPVPAYEASLLGERSVYNRSRSPPPAHQNSPSPQGEPIPHFPGGVPLRPHDLPPAHLMHHHIQHMYQQYLRQSHYLPRGLEKPGDSQEGEEAPVTSPPLELRRPGSVGMALTGRSGAVPHSLQSPHDRATDSPQVYNMHTARMQQHYHPGRFYDQAEPPPAHRPLTSIASLAGGLGPLPDRPLSHSALPGHVATLPERPLSGHIAPDRPLSGHMPPDRPLSAQSVGIERPLSAHIAPDRPLVGHIASDRPPPGHMAPDRPLSSHLPPDRGVTGPGLGMGGGLGAAGNLMGAVARHIGAEAPASQRGLQAATPPHASQVPPQAESLLMLLRHYPCMWQGLLALKNDQAAVQMYFISGNDTVARMSLPKNCDGSTPPLRIFQRMRLEPPQVEGVARKMQVESEHCILLALPCGHDHMDVLKQSTNLTTGFITYLQQKQSAGIVNVAAPGTTQPPAYVVHMFPSCDFVNDNLRRIAPSLLERVADIAHLLIVITTV